MMIKEKVQRMLDKTYLPAEVETKHYSAWEKSGAFAAGVRGAAKPYTIMMPPPNITGSLHMGHALNHTLQDIPVRRQERRERSGPQPFLPRALPPERCC